MGLVLLYQDFNSGAPAAAIYDSQTGEVRRISDPDSAGAAEDIPAGWAGTAAYWLRVNGDGTVAMMGYDVNTGETFTIWEGGERSLTGVRPVSTGDGFLIPTQSSWLRIGLDGSEAELGPNDVGITGEAFLSPFATLIAYPAGGQIVIAESAKPGIQVAAGIPYVDGPGSGFTWSPDGSYLAVSDGFSIQIYDYQGTFVSAVISESGVSIAAPQWLSDGLYYIELAPTPSLRRLTNEKIPGFGG
ncbi:MAG: hypothetical protein M3Y37_10035, partial [Chloroflexota bacterium]|nr:hypothetical protein [Chloroflexota bacterium]